MTMTQKFKLMRVMENKLLEAGDGKRNLLHASFGSKL
jgi:hypothetical protein